MLSGDKEQNIWEARIIMTETSCPFCALPRHSQGGQSVDILPGLLN